MVARNNHISGNYNPSGFFSLTDTFYPAVAFLFSIFFSYHTGFSFSLLFANVPTEGYYVYFYIGFPENSRFPTGLMVRSRPSCPSLPTMIKILPYLIVFSYIDLQRFTRLRSTGVYSLRLALSFLFFLSVIVLCLVI